jgi:hypothetical protein
MLRSRKRAIIEASARLETNQEVQQKVAKTTKVLNGVSLPLW